MGLIGGVAKSPAPVIFTRVSVGFSLKEMGWGKNPNPFV
jgi:hypothetical protein